MHGITVFVQRIRSGVSWEHGARQEYRWPCSAFLSLQVLRAETHVWVACLTSYEDWHVNLRLSIRNFACIFDGKYIFHMNLS